MALAVAAIWLTSPLWRSAIERSQVGNDVRADNNVVVALNKLLPADRAVARVTDGVSFSTLDVALSKSGTAAHIRVTAYASANEPNVGVVAVFLAGESTPLTVVTAPLANNQPGTIDFELDVRRPGRFLSFDFRMGPGAPGTIVFNGPQGPPGLRTTRIHITERP